MKILDKSSLFDKNFYRSAVGKRIMLLPSRHFHRIGWKQGIDPSRHFSVGYYLNTYPDVALSGVNPLLHYLSYGWKEGRWPNPDFDQKLFVDAHKALPRTEKLPIEQCVELYGEARWPLDDKEAEYPGIMLSASGQQEWRSLFDEAYYRSHYSDLEGLPGSAFQHFISLGWREDRNPSAGFDMAHYKRVLRESEPNAHPMRDLNRFRHDLTGFASGRDHILLDRNPVDRPADAVGHLRLAVHFHAYYPEVIADLIPSIGFFPEDTRLVVTTCAHADAVFIENLLAERLDDPRKAYVSVRVVENRGRDIGPFLVACRDLWTDSDLLLHLHSKASPHVEWGNDWRSYLFDQLFGSPQILDDIRARFAKTPDLGMLYPENYFRIKKFAGKQGNHPRVAAFLQGLPGFLPSMLNSDFAAGSMAWFRTAAFTALLDKVPDLQPFEIENRQLDFTLAHVLERALPIAAKAAGFKAQAYSTGLRHRRPVAAIPFQRDPDHDQSGSRWRRDTPAIARSAPQPLKPLTRLFNPQALNLHWIIPEFDRGAGGHMTIFRMVRFLEQFGHHQTIWLQNARADRGPRSAHAAISGWYQHIGPHVAVRHLPDDVRCISGDAVIATDCWTAYPAAQVTNVKERFYFIQDHETEFHPAGELQLTAEATYHMGFAALCAGPWLLQHAQTYGMWARAWPLCADGKHYMPVAKSDMVVKRPKIAFYCRPYTPRRAVNLGLAALEVLHEQGVEFEAHLFGEDNLSLELSFDHVHHGVLTPEQLGDLYRSCDIGVVFSTTNYSLIPLEMMASGLPVIELDVPSTRAVFTNDIATLAPPNPTDIAAAIATLLKSPEKRAAQIRAGLDFAKGLNWETSARLVEAAILERLGERGITPIAPKDICAPHLARPRKASVFIPTLNAGPSFGALLDRLDAQETGFDFDVLIIDSGSRDQTVEAVKARKSGRFRLHEIEKSQFQHGRTRNLGIEMTDGEYVAILTQDALPADRHWLSSLIGGFSRSPKVAGVIGRHHAYPEHGSFAKRDLQEMFDRLKLLPDIYSLADGLPGFIIPGSTHWQMLMQFYSDNNSAMSRAVWKILPYPEIDWGEDQVWAWEALKLGFDKVYVDQAAVYHSHDFDFSQQFEVARTEGRFWSEHFGITLVGDTEASTAAANAADTSYATAKGIAVNELERRMQANQASSGGRHLGAKEALPSWVFQSRRAIRNQ